MSRKKYDYDKCYEIAKQCTCASEMQKLNGSAYNVARKNNSLRDYNWFVRKQHTTYTYEEVYEIAKGYTCSSEFQKGNGSAYGKARAKGWIQDYYWFNIKQHAPYTYEECYNEAKKYTSRVMLARGNVGVYQAALNHGWLDDYTWFQSDQKPYNWWTKERVIEESKKYKNRGDFHDNNGTAYSKARTNGWLDEFTWLKDDRIDFSNDKIDCVYAYEFKEINAVYIGRTLMRRARERDREHIFIDNDAVYLFAKEKEIPVPKMLILEDFLTVKEGTEKEGFYLEQYRKGGWNILNRAKTGGIGLLFKDKWTKKTCREEALKYKTRGEFAKKSAGAYDVARRKKWLDDYTWFEEKQKPVGFWDVYENCFNAAKQCRTKSDFIHKYSTAFVHARENDWLKDYTWFNDVKRAPRRWDFYATFEEAKKYKTRKDFAKGSSGAYKAAHANGWINFFDWFEDPKVVLKRAIIATKKRKWTYEACKQIARESKGRLDFRRRSPGAYNAAWENKWLDKLFPETKGKHRRKKKK